MEKKALQQTLDNHLNYLKKFSGELTLQHYLDLYADKEQRILDEKDMDMDKENEQHYYYQQGMCREKVQRQIVMEKKTKDHFLALKNYRILVHGGIL